MKQNKFLIKIGNTIVNLRYIILVIFIAFLIISIKNINNVKINDDIIKYLPDKTETIKGLELQKKEFKELNEIQLLITDINYEDVLNRVDNIKKIKYVNNVVFNNTENYYKDNNALIIIQIEKTPDTKMKNIKNSIIDTIIDDNYYLYIENNTSPKINITPVLIILIIITGLIILITSRSYFDIILTYIILSVSILLNIGSNFMIKEISNLAIYITIIFQSALTTNYLIIFLNNYNKEIYDNSKSIIAIKKTVTKSIPLITISSITILSGIIALSFMNLKIGNSISIVLSKGIICSVLTIILLLPCLLFIFNKIILKLRHRIFIFNINKITKKIISYRKIILPTFLIILIISIFLISKHNFIFINFEKTSEEQLAYDKINTTFGINNRLTVIVKNKDKDYTKELNIAQKLLQDKKVISVTNVGNTKIDEKLYLGSSINYEDLKTLFDLDIDLSKQLFELYATEKDEVIKLNDINNYHISIINLITFIQEKQPEILLNKNIINYYSNINNLKEFLESDNYSRFIIDYKGEKESNDTLKLIDMIKEDINKEYGSVTLVGESINSCDLRETFRKDIFKITCIATLLVFIILLLTNESIIMSLILIITIKGSILINFGFISLIQNKLYFICYLIAFIIQMSLTINYATIISNKYQMLRKTEKKLNAIAGAINESFPVIIISGSIIFISCFLIRLLIHLKIASQIGLLIGIGTIISIISTLFILPSLLFIFDKLIYKKGYKKRKKISNR